MDNNTINDIANKLKDIKNETIEEVVVEQEQSEEIMKHQKYLKVIYNQVI